MSSSRSTAGLVQRGFGRVREPFPCLCSFAHPFSSSTMLGVWLRPEYGCDSRWFPTVASALAHLKDKGTALWPTHASRAAQQVSTRNGWCFYSKDRNAVDAKDEAPAPFRPTTGSTLPPWWWVSSHPEFALPSCRCPTEKRLGDILLCSGGNQRVHALFSTRLNVSNVCAAFVTLHPEMSCANARRASIGFMPVELFLCHIALRWYVSTAS